jgi:hypothetical protein
MIIINGINIKRKSDIKTALNVVFPKIDIRKSKHLDYEDFEESDNNPNTYEHEEHLGDSN